MLDSVLVTGAGVHTNGVCLELPFNFLVFFINPILNNAGVGLGVGDRCRFPLYRCLS